MNVVDDGNIAPGTLFKCNRCGHIWISRKSDGIPRSCPKCRSVIWNKNCKVVHCVRCDHEWVSTKDRPGRCPKCHTARWDVPIENSLPPSACKSKVTMDPVIIKHVQNLYSEGKTAFQIACDTGISYQSTRAILEHCNESKE